MIKLAHGFLLLITAMLSCITECAKKHNAMHNQLMHINIAWETGSGNVMKYHNRCESGNCVNCVTWKENSFN